MSRITFNRVTRDGQRVAKVAVTFYVVREDLLRTTLTVGAELIEEVTGEPDEVTPEMVGEYFRKVTRTAVEAKLRDGLESYGTIWQESADNENGAAYILTRWDAEELLVLCRFMANITVDRLFPEVIV